LVRARGSPLASSPHDSKSCKHESFLLLSVLTLRFLHKVALHILMNKSRNECLVGDSPLSRFSLDTHQVMAT